MLLLLAGTTEAREIASALKDLGIPAMASLAGATRSPGALDLPTRVGGFGGEQAFEDFLQDNAVTAILDATHPFAERISERSARIAARRGIPYLQLLRPEWQATDLDNWTTIAGAEDAARHIPAGSTVFLATGRQSLPGFANLSCCRLICRRIDPPKNPFPFANGGYLVGRAPFTAEGERALFEQLGVEVLVTKNAGGTGGWPKLEAARALALPVLMISRPPPLEVPCVPDVASAIDWARGVT